MTKPLRQLKYPKVPRLLSAVLKVTAPVVMGIMAVALPIAIGFPDITIWSVGFLVAFLLLDIWLIRFQCLQQDLCGSRHISGHRRFAKGT